VSYGVIKLGKKVANLAKCWPPAIKKSLHITIKRFNTTPNGSPQSAEAGATATCTAVVNPLSKKPIVECPSEAAHP